MKEHRLVMNFNNIINGKVYFFLRKSLIRYIILTIILGLLNPINEYGGVKSGFIYFVGLNIMLWPLLYFSAKIQAKANNFDVNVEFSEENIKVSHNNQDLVETKDWDWFKRIEITKDRVWFTVNQIRPFILSLPKSKLSQSEIELFERMKK